MPSWLPTCPFPTGHPNASRPHCPLPLPGPCRSGPMKKYSGPRKKETHHDAPVWRLRLRHGPRFRMVLQILFLALALVLPWGLAHGEEYIYTWKDRNGVLNITDYAPPPGAEILEISPSHRKEAEEYWRRRQMLREKAERAAQQKRMQQAAAGAAQSEADARQEADAYFEQAGQMVEGVKGSGEKKRRYFRRAKRLADHGEKKIHEAERRRKEAERLKKKLHHP